MYADRNIYNISLNKRLKSKKSKSEEKNMYKNKLIAAIGMSMVLVGGMIGCGNKNNATTQTQPASSKPETATQSNITTLPANENKPVVDAPNATETATEAASTENGTEAVAEEAKQEAVAEAAEAVEAAQEIIEQVTEPAVVETPAETPVEAAVSVPTPAPVEEAPAPAEAAPATKNENSNSNAGNNSSNGSSSNSSSKKVVDGSFGATSVDELPTNSNGDIMGHITYDDGSFTNSAGTFSSEEEFEKWLESVANGGYMPNPNAKK